MQPGFRFALPQASRRDVLRAAAATGLIVGFQLPGRGAKLAYAAPADGVFRPNAFVRIAPDNSVTVLIKHLEMGQGTYTGLTTLVAEELDADWAQTRAEHAPADPLLYNNLMWGPAQGTGGSSSVANSFEQLRKAGAAARAMLVQAAADKWGVPASQVGVSKGVVSAGDRKATFGELAEAAAKVTPPKDPPLKDPKDFTLIGKPVPRLDSVEKTTGKAVYAMDFTLPGALVAVVERPPVFGAKVKAFDASEAKKVPGVVDVVQIPRGVAVLATGFWAAKRGREALDVTWDQTGAEVRDSGTLLDIYRGLGKAPGLPAWKDGDADAALGTAAKVVRAEFDFPYLAHTPMEPLNCVAKLAPDGSVDIWAGDQFQTGDQGNAAKLLGIKPDQVRIHTLYAGGSFGRRANPESDYIVEAVSIAKAINGKAPVKLIWTREDDVTGGRYRPMYHHVMAAGLDAQGKLVAWKHRIVGQSILIGTPFEGMMVKGGIDATSVEGAANLPYAVPNVLVDVHNTDVGVPVLWWRSVGSTHNGFATEVFIDELAHAAGKDPYAFRRELLGKHPRHLAVLDLAAEKAGWGKPLPAGRARGIAVHESFNSVVAQVVELSMSGGRLKVERVVCAVDCGLAVNPDVVRAQMEGGIGFGLGAALGEAITLAQGKVEQSNFHDYTPLRIDRMPDVEVHIVPSAAPPTGVGEPGVPPIAPAVSNALFSLTGKRVRSLPFATQGVEV
ncbi:molybdopterin cofactor-binding domain-containing protein [Azospirillum sp.]|uniref:xanthine dehydrogenase family protein molybdopterin-binding subunit n=1 Tax=Azospirillum sp. TaxID=34012 RepID=UPI003D72881C